MTIRALVVDDSAFMRKVISDILNNDPNITVIATARNGQDAIVKTESLRPDVITLDNHMPVLDGLHALGYIMSECPTPVVMLSAVDEKAAQTTLTAFEYGAVDFIQKPSGSISLDIDSMAEEIRHKVKSATRVDLSNLGFMEEHVTKTLDTEKSEEKNLKVKLKSKPKQKASKKVIAIGSSTGGPRALEKLIPKLPGNLPVPVLVVQHMPAGFTESFAKRLNSKSSLEVREAKEGDIIEKGTVYFAPGDYHMEVAKKNIRGVLKEVISLNQKPREHGVRPSVNVLLRSLKPVYGSDVLSVILTGMGSDGSEGVSELRNAGAQCIAEDKTSCIIYGMPKTIVEKKLADYVAPIDDIAKKIVDTIA
ncbi:MAG: chemotaxis response regulator protein-glutamate methylesterase [Methanohalobium sp.]|uniref:protein-glutamate methylesterase/protein-glutamine glutaminase n=1 Tax=Methanohalobium sp. TaxID=2837493 RepID=UPI00397ABB57